MANVLTISYGLTVTGDGNTVKQTGSFSVDQVGQNYILNIQDIGLTAEAIILGDAAPGFICFKNAKDKLVAPVGQTLTAQQIKDYYDANLIAIGNDSLVSTVVAKLGPQEGVTIPTTQATWYAKSLVTACPLAVLCADA